MSHSQKPSTRTAVDDDENAKENVMDTTIDSHVSKTTKNEHHDSGTVLTPSKQLQRVKRKTDAGYHFKQLMAPTPLRKLPASAMKKHHMTPRIKAAPVNSSYLSNSSDSSGMSSDDSPSSSASSTDQALLDLKNMLDGNSTGANDLSMASGLSRGGHSKAASMSSDSNSGASSGLMNRSVLSDTTELTASNFVLTANSKQCMLDWTREDKKRKQQELAKRNKENEENVPPQQLEKEQSLQEGKEEENQLNHNLHAHADEIPEDKLARTHTQTSVDRMSTYDAAEEKKDDSLDIETAQEKLAASSSYAPEGQISRKEHLESSFSLSQTSATRGSLGEGRNSLSGPSPTLNSRVQVSPKSLRKFTASLKRDRVKRQLELEQLTKRKLSMGSARKQVPPRPSTSRFSVGSLANSNQYGRQSVGSARKTQNYERLDFLQDGTPGSEQEDASQRWHLSDKLAQSPYRSTPRKEKRAIGGSSREAKSASSSAERVQVYDDNENTAEINFEFGKWIREPLNAPMDASASSIRNSASAVALRRLSKQTAPENTEITMKNSESGSRKMGTSLLRLSTSNNGSEHASRTPGEEFNGNVGNVSEPFGSGTRASGNEFSLQQASAARTDHMSTFKDDKENTSGERKKPPTEIAVAHSSQESSQDGTPVNNNDISGLHSPSPLPTMSPENCSSFLLRSASKLTPSRLSGGPRRIVNPDSLLSPARNTRSASKKIAASIESKVQNEEDSRSGKRKAPPSEIAVALSSQESPQGGTPVNDNNISGLHSPSPSSNVPPENRSSLSASKLTPSRLSKKPRRVVNPDSLLSPARNTRSASKKKAASVEKAHGGIATAGTPRNLLGLSPATFQLHGSPQSNGSGEDVIEHKQSAVDSTEKSEAENSSTAPSNRSSMTASMTDLAELFDLANDRSGSNDDTVDTATRNKRRETASYSDLGEIMAYFDDDGEQDDTRNSILSRKYRRGRRSSMFRSSLASLPEQAALLNRSTDDADRTGGENDDGGDGDGTMQSPHSADEGETSMGQPSSAQGSKKTRLNDEDDTDGYLGLLDTSDMHVYTNQGASITDKDQDQSKMSSSSNAANASRDSSGTVSSTVDLNSLFDGLSTVSSALSPGSTTNDATAQRKETDKSHDSSRNCDTSAKANGSSTSSSKGGQPKVFLNSSSSSAEDMSPPCATNLEVSSEISDGEKMKEKPASEEFENESDDGTTVQNDDDNTASLADINAILGNVSVSTDSSIEAAETAQSNKSNTKRSLFAILDDASLASNGSTGSGRSKRLRQSAEGNNDTSSSCHEASDKGASSSDLNMGEEDKETDSMGKVGDLQHHSSPTLPQLPPEQVDVTSGKSSIAELSQQDQAEDADLKDGHRKINVHPPMSALKGQSNSGVLNSALKKPGEAKNPHLQSVKKSVNFKSPQAAEYNIGAVSSNLTPMPKNQAKHRYPLPDMSNDSDMSTSSSPDNVSLSPVSPCAKSLETSLNSSLGQACGVGEEEEVTVTLELNMHELFEKLGDAVDPTKNVEGSPSSADSSYVDGSRVGGSVENTIELEPNIQELFQNTENNSRDNNSSLPPGSVMSGNSSQQSHQHTDTDGIDEASPVVGNGHTRLSHGSSASSASFLSKSPMSRMGGHNHAGKYDEEQTLELEENMAALLEAVDDRPDQLDSHEQNLNESNSSQQLHQHDGTAKQNGASRVAGNGKTRPSNESFASSALSPSFSSKSFMSHSGRGKYDEEQTMELEENMAALLEAVDARPDQLGSRAQNLNELDVSAIPSNSPNGGGPSPWQSASLLDKSDGSQKSSFASPGSAFAEYANDSTVQLENNLDELFAATVSKDDAEESSIDNNHQQSFTETLEDNMAMIFNGTSAKDPDGTAIDCDIRDSPESRGLRSRRSSITSHRLSLEPEGNFVISKEGDISSTAPYYEDTSRELAVEQLLVPSDSPNKNETGSPQTSQPTFDLTSQELMNIAGLGGCSDSLCLDVLLDFAEHAHAVHITDKFVELAEAACGQFETTNEDGAEANATFDEKIAEQKDLYLPLQLQLRNPHDDGEAKEHLKAIAAASSSLTRSEFESWAAQAILSLQENGLKDIMTLLQDETSEVDRALQRIEDAHTRLSSLASASARRARRASMRRRKVCSQY